MTSSMTGFGRGTATVAGVTATVELRSVNNRYCDVTTRLPKSLADYDSKVQQRLKEAFDRGRISVSVQVEEPDADTLVLRVDPKAARAYADLLEELRRAAGIEEPVRLEHLLGYSDVFTTPEAGDEAAEKAWPAASAALEEAVEVLREMRRQEGTALEEELRRRADNIERLLADVEQRAPLRVAEARDKLRARLEELILDDRVDEDRIATEIAILADKLDVTEECVRLRSHLQLFRESLAAEAAEGRKLNFIAQEIHREINTIGSKANDAEVARIAVGMKDELEKIREQVQNVE